MVAVNEYEKSVGALDDTDVTKSFAKLGEIIDEFVRDGSPFEVNIGSTTKSAVLKMADAANFKELSSVRITQSNIVPSKVG